MDYIPLIPRDLIVILHLFGVALGAGAAYVSDAMFFASINDRKLVKDELRFMKLGSTLVWLGLAMLFVSGLGLFLKDPEFYLNSSKFWAKMTIVTIVALNGVIFHLHHIPLLDRILDKHISILANEAYRRITLLFSGVLSFTSWTFALVLGTLRTVPLGYWQIMGLYTSIVMVGALGVISVREHLLPSSEKLTHLLSLVKPEKKNKKRDIS